MRRIIKVLLLTAAALVGVLAAAAVLVALLFDPNDYKEQIAREVEARSGRTLAIDGDLELGIFPWLRITSGPMVLGNAPGFDDGPFARIEGVSAGLRLLPLLRREIEIGNVRLLGLELNLEVDAEGRSNWADLAGAEPVADSPGDPPGDPDDAGFDLAGLRIAGVEVRDANLRYRDAAAGQSYALERFNLTLDALALGEPVQARFDFGVSQQAPAVQGRIEGRTLLLVDAAFERLRLNDLRIDAHVDGGEGFPLETLSAQWRLASAEIPLTPAGAQAPGGFAALEGIRLSGLELREAGLHYRDEAADQVLRLENLTVSLAEVVLNEPIEARFGLDLEQHNPPLRGRIEGGAALELNAASQMLHVRELRIDSRLDGPADAALEALQAELSVAAVDYSLDDAGAATPAQALESLRVSGVELRNGALRYREADQRYTLEDLRLTLDSLAPGQTSAISLGSRFTQQDPPLQGQLDATLAVRLDAAAERVQLTDLRVASRFDGDAGAPLETLEAQLTLGAAELSLAAGAHATGLVADAIVSGAELPASGLALRLLADGVEADPEAGTAGVQSLRLEVAGIELRAALQASGLLQEPLSASGSFEVVEFSPRRALAIMEVPLETADETALARASARGELRVAGTDLWVSNLQLGLDETTLRGRVSQVAGKLEFDLDGTAIDLDRYLPPPDEAEVEEEATVALDDIEIPADALRALQAEGELRMAALTISGVELRNLIAGVTAGGGELRLHPLSAGLYEGAYAGDVRLEVHEAQVPRLFIDQHLDDVQLAPLSRALHQEARASGRIDARFEMVAAGHTVGEMRRSLDGEVGMALRDGAWEGVDLRHELRRAQALYRQQAAPERAGPARTEFRNVRFTGKVSDGVMATDDLSADLRFLEVAGNGGVNLLEGTLDYRLDARFFDEPELAGDALLADLRGARLPLRIDGALTSPRVQPDFTALVRDQVIDRVREEALRRLTPRGGEAAEEDAGETPERPQDTLRRGLRDLLGN